MSVVRQTTATYSQKIYVIDLINVKNRDLVYI